MPSLADNYVRGSANDMPPKLQDHSSLFMHQDDILMRLHSKRAGSKHKNHTKVISWYNQRIH